MDDEAKDFVKFLPPELLEIIFANVGEKGIHSSLLTCKAWMQFVDNDNAIWQVLCKDLDKDDIEEDLVNGLSWKTIFLNNQGVKGTVRRWMKGKYSHLNSYDELASQKVMAVFDVDTWGLILEAELRR